VGTTREIRALIRDGCGDESSWRRGDSPEGWNPFDDGGWEDLRCSVTVALASAPLSAPSPSATPRASLKPVTAPPLKALLAARRRRSLVAVTPHEGHASVERARPGGQRDTGYYYRLISRCPPGGGQRPAGATGAPAQVRLCRAAPGHPPLPRWPCSGATWPGAATASEM
jgi:hypothetical protein